MFKKVIAVFLVGIMALSLGGCGIKQKLEEKIAQKVTEGVINKAIGGEGKVSLDGDKVTIKGKDGAEVTYGDTKWPKGKAADQIPEFKKGNIVSAINSDKMCMVIIEDVEEKDYEAYVEAVKNKGYTEESGEISSEDLKSYYGKADEKKEVSVSYEMEGKTLNITVAISE